MESKNGTGYNLKIANHISGQRERERERSQFIGWRETNCLHGECEKFQYIGQKWPKLVMHTKI